MIFQLNRRRSNDYFGENKDNKIEIVHEKKEKLILIKIHEVLHKISEKEEKDYVPLTPYTIKIAKQLINRKSGSPTKTQTH